MEGKSIINFDCGPGLAFVVPLFALCRSFSFEGRLTASVVTLLLVLYLYTKRRVCIYTFDIFLITIPFVILCHKSPFYPWKDCMYFLIAWLSYFVFRSEKCYRNIIQACLYFYFVNFFFNIINLIAPDLYLQFCSLFFDNQSVKDINYYYFNEGFISGLSDHYSRNAYFFVLGCSVYVSRLFSTSDYNKIDIAMSLLSIIMIMYIGKRGHLLFLVLSIAYVGIIIKNGVREKLFWLLKNGVLCLVVIVTLLALVPNLLFALERFNYQLSSGDISTGRFELWSKAWDYFLQKPLIGWGYGFFSTTEKNYYLDSFFAGVHNDYLQWLCELGVLGLCINIIPATCVYYITHRIIKEMFRPNIVDKNLVARAFISWSLIIQTFVLIYSLTGLPHFDFEINIIYYIAMAIPIFFLDHYKFSSFLTRKVILKW